jgi:arginyl-tRNA synthetase
LKLAREQSENNPVYYLQYAHARIASIIRFAQSEGIDLTLEPDFALLKIKEEISLIKSLLTFPDMIAGCASALEPHRLCTYLQDAATNFHKFYHECRVVTDDRQLTAARIALCRAAKQVIANGLLILGIHAPEKM